MTRVLRNQVKQRQRTSAPLHRESIISRPSNSSQFQTLQDIRSFRRWASLLQLLGFHSPMQLLHRRTYSVSWMELWCYMLRSCTGVVRFLLYDLNHMYNVSMPRIQCRRPRCHARSSCRPSPQVVKLFNLKSECLCYRDLTLVVLCVIRTPVY